MRGTVADLTSAHPLGAHLPTLYAGDPFAQGLVGACDEVLAPVLGVLDMLDAYLDPQLAPPDFVLWLGSWLGETVAEAPTSPERQERLREAVSAAGSQLGRAGTASAIAAAVALAAGVDLGDVDVVDSGGTTSSADPLAELPGEPLPRLAIRVRAANSDAVDLAAVDAAVAATKPAHLRHTVSVVEAGPGTVR